MNLNQISSLNEDIFFGLNGLKTLDLNYNKITNVSSSIFNGLDSLNYLFLIGNQIKTFSSNSFNVLNNLKGLKLDSNKIEYLVDNSILKNLNFDILEYISLKNCSIQISSRDFFSTLPFSNKNVTFFLALNPFVYSENISNYCYNLNCIINLD